MPRLPLPILLFLAATADAKIINVVTMEQLVKEQPVILIAKVAVFLPEKPGMVLAPVEKLRGEFPFGGVPVNLKGDQEAIKEKQPALVLDRLEKDLPLVIFASRRGRTYVAVAYTNGTWIRMSGRVEKDADKEVTRWQFQHCETYFRRTYKGTTAEMIETIRGGLKGKKLPPYNPKEKPGYGPPLKKKRPSPTSAGPMALPFGVIQIPFLGLIAALAALFPAVFGGMALMMRRWVAALSVASLVSVLSALVLYFPNWIGWTGIKSLTTMWITGAIIAGLGAFWAAHRYRRAIRVGRGDDFQPRYLDRIGLTRIRCGCSRRIGLRAWHTAVVAGIALDGSRRSSGAVVGVFVFRNRSSLASRTGRSSGTDLRGDRRLVGWLVCVCCCRRRTDVRPARAGIVIAAGSARVKLVAEPLWIFQPKENGQIRAKPCVTAERIYVSVHHRKGFDQYGVVYALDPRSGSILWQFDNEQDLKPLFSSPVCADGRLYFGEGYHTDHNSKLFCLDAATGTKLWEFPTQSHTESSPVVADGKVVFGAGDDGMYCVAAATGKKVWQFPSDGGLHIDSNPLIHDGKVFAGSGTSQRSKSTRIFCVDLKTGQEIWSESTAYSAWGSPVATGNLVYFATGNGTFSEDREPVAGMVLCREAETGKPIWQRPLANSVVSRPAVDRYQVYVGCRDGNCYALDRRTGDVVWSKSLQSPVLAAPAIDVSPQMGIGEVLYAIGNLGELEALSPADGSLFWAINFRSLIDIPYVESISTPVVVRDNQNGTQIRRVYVGLAFAPSPDAAPTARLYCFLNTAD